MILDCASLTIKDHFCSLLISNIIFVFLTFFRLDELDFSGEFHELKFLFTLSDLCFSSSYTTTLDKKMKN